MLFLIEPQYGVDSIGVCAQLSTAAHLTRYTLRNSGQTADVVNDCEMLKSGVGK
jgi:hypothetical protein